MALDLKKPKGSKRSGVCAVEPELPADFQVRILLVRKEDGATITSSARGISEKHAEKVYSELQKAMP